MKVKLFVTVLIFSLSATAMWAATDAVLRPGDSFELRISGVPAEDMTSVTGSYTIDGGGGLNLPYVGKLNVSGMTPNQVQILAERSYVDKGIFTHPTITLTIAPAMRYVNVGGHVRAPQRVAYTADMTVLSAINAAGDFDDFAKQTAVKLIRGKEVTIVNVKAIKNNPALDVQVLPGDQIQVPESMF